jgi:hypothetical protein
VQDALDIEAELRGSPRTFLSTGTVNADTCQSLREWGGNAQSIELETLVASWGSQLQAACAEAGFGPAAAAGGYPWLTRSADTLALQQRIQAELRSRGRCPITEPFDGILGPQTCAAGLYLEVGGTTVQGWAQAKANCQSYSQRWRPNPPCAGAAVQEPLPAAPVPAAMPVAAGGGGIGAGGVALLAAAAIGAVYLLTQA